jgi:CHAT domain-containing protein
VLSACDVGVGQAVGVDELLGVVTALMSVGSAGVLASVLPVPDAGAAELSVTVHQRLLAGDDLAQALQHARSAGSGPPLAATTAGAFVAFGAR